MSNEQEMREAFEADFKSRHSAPDFVKKYDSLFRWNDSCRWYETPWINQHWETWQAATLAAEARIRDVCMQVATTVRYAALSGPVERAELEAIVSRALTEHKENQDGN